MARTHTVKSGETLSGIAEKFGVNFNTITGFRSGDPNLIFPGETLTIPDVPSATTTPTTRLSGESIEDFTQRIGSGIQDVSRQTQDLVQRVETEGITTTQPTPAPTFTPAPPTVGTSASLRAEQRKKELEELRKSLGIGAPPTAPDLFTEEDKERLGIARDERGGIETELTSILDERLRLTEEFRKFSGEQVGLPEAGRRGAISEEGRAVQEQLDALNRREVVLETKLRNRNNVISELMSLQGQEFADATAQYNKSFSQAIQLYNLFDKQQDELQRNAKANLDVIANAYQAQIEAGQLTIDQITGIQRVKLEEYEAQAGLPIGSTLAVLQTLKPGEEKLYSGVDDDGTFVYITRDVNGRINVKKIPGVRSPSDTTGQDFELADQFIADNPDASRADIKVGLLENTDLTISEINAKLDAAGIIEEKQQFTDDQIRNIAIALVKSFATPFDITEAFTEGGEAAKAIEIVKLGIIEINEKNVELSQRQKDQIIAAIEEEFPSGSRTFFNKLLPTGK